MTTLQGLLDQGTATLERTGIKEPRREAQRILAHVMQVDPAALLGRAETEAPPAVAPSFLDKITHRSSHSPLSHVLGFRDFWTHRFSINPFVLDPRPETEILVAAALEAPFSTVLDLGTGSGCIILSLMAERPGARGTATDISPEALDVARLNAQTLGIADRVDFIETDWASGLTGPFDLVVSNPPYIAASEMAGLHPEVRDHEPHLALTDGGDGLGAYRAIAASARDLLAPGGRLAVEFGAGQAEDVGRIFAAAGLAQPEIRDDLDGRARVAIVHMPPPVTGSKR